MKSTPRPARRLPLRLVSAGLLMFSSSGSALAQQSPAREWSEQMMYSIRRNVPNPPAHARNLFHVAVAMYDAWAAYDTTAVGYIYNEKGPPLGWEWEELDARNEAISYAAYRILKTRFAQSTFPVGFPQVKIDAVHTSLDNKFAAMGYDKVNAL